MWKRVPPGKKVPSFANHLSYQAFFTKTFFLPTESSSRPEDFARVACALIFPGSGDKLMPRVNMDKSGIVSRALSKQSDPPLVLEKTFLIQEKLSFRFVGVRAKAMEVVIGNAFLRSR